MTTSRIDELQRLHEAAEAQTSNAWRCMEASWQTYQSWPAIHRVLVAARVILEECDIQSDDPTVVPEFVEALRALDHGETNT